MKLTLNEHKNILRNIDFKFKNVFNLNINIFTAIQQYESYYKYNVCVIYDSIYNNNVCILLRVAYK